MSLLLLLRLSGTLTYMVKPVSPTWRCPPAPREPHTSLNYPREHPRVGCCLPNHATAALVIGTPLERCIRAPSFPSRSFATLSGRTVPGIVVPFVIVQFLFLPSGFSQRPPLLQPNFSLPASGRSFWCVTGEALLPLPTPTSPSRKFHPSLWMNQTQVWRCQMLLLGRKTFTGNSHFWRGTPFFPAWGYPILAGTMGFNGLIPLCLDIEEFQMGWRDASPMEAKPHSRGCWSLWHLLFSKIIADMEFPPFGS